MLSSWHNQALVSREGQDPIPVRDIWQLRGNVMNPEFMRFFDENVIYG